jgi:hypothetical protein
LRAARRTGAPTPSNRLLRAQQREGFASLSWQRTDSHSRLARLIGGGPLPGAGEAGGMDFAERMSTWLGAVDAIALQTAQRDAQAVATALSARAHGAAVPLDEEFQQVRQVLLRAIARDPAQDAMPLEPPYTCYQRRHAELQRQMTQMVGALRQRAREQMGGHSARLRQLAVLDAAMEQLLARREQGLLVSAAAALERQFKPVQKEAAPQWQEHFTAHWQQALQAELDLRLAPAAGLVAALRNEQNNKAHP